MKQIIIMVLIIAAAIIIGGLVSSNLQTASTGLITRTVTDINAVNP